MQPLSYQLAKTTCWPACVLNGIRFLLGKNRLETPVYRIVHSLLQDRGVVYYKSRDREALKEVYWRLEKYTGLSFECRRRGRVAPTLLDLDLNGAQVAICDVGNGDHSILLTERNGVWLKAFDPYWYAQREANRNVRFVDEWHANIEFRLDHLINDSCKDHEEAFERGEAFPMGKNIGKRFLTIIEKRGG